MQTVSTLLADGPQSAVILTVPDWRVLKARLCAASRECTGTFGNDVYNVQFADDMRDRLVALSGEEVKEGDDMEEAAWGIKYSFDLGDAVRDCEESIVHVPSLQGVAAKHGLSVSHFQDLSSFIVHSCDEPCYRGMLGRMKACGGGGRPLSAVEWEAVSLYAVLVLRRAPT
jgi:hypothetical protein